MNLVILEGIVATEPEVQYFGLNHLRVDFKLYTEERLPTQDEGERSLRLHHHVVIWSAELAKEAEISLHKGQKVHLEGRISYTSYNKGEDSRTLMQVECHTLYIINERTILQNHPTSTPAVDIDWGNFSPSSQEDPMA